MRIGLAVPVGEGIRVSFASLRLHPLFKVVVTPQAGKNLPSLIGIKEHLETATVRVGNQSVLPAEKQRVCRLHQPIAGLQPVLALQISSTVGFTSRCQPVFRVMHTDDDLLGLYANVIAPQRQRLGQPQSAVVHEVGNQDIAKVCRPA